MCIGRLDRRRPPSYPARGAELAPSQSHAAPVRHGELLRLIPLRSALYNARMPNKRLFPLTRAEGALTRKPGEFESPCNGVTEAIRIICEAHALPKRNRFGRRPPLQSCPLGNRCLSSSVRPASAAASTRTALTTPCLPASGRSGAFSDPRRSRQSALVLFDDRRRGR